MEDERPTGDLILGGYSQPNKICIYSCDFRATASYDQKSGNISIDTAKPKAGRKAAISGLKMLALMTAAFLLLTLLLFVGINTEIAFWITVVTFGIFQIVFPRIGVAPWHGAEHKVIEAYRKTGKNDLEEARRMSPVTDRCGARVFFAIVLAFAVLLAIFHGYDRLVRTPHLWFDTLVAMIGAIFMGPFCLAELNVCKWLSRGLQEALTVREPNEVQLKTAYLALDALLKQHESEK